MSLGEAQTPVTLTHVSSILQSVRRAGKRVVSQPPPWPCGLLNADTHVGRICMRSSTDPVATVLTQAATEPNLDDGAPREKSDTQTTNVKCPEQTNPQRQQIHAVGR